MDYLTPTTAGVTAAAAAVAVAAVVSHRSTLRAALRAAHPGVRRFITTPHSTATVEVTTSCGPIRGVVTASGSSIDFRGVPFAAPLIGINLFAPPQPVEPWTAPRDCTLFGPAVWQNADGSGTLSLFGVAGGVEENYGSYGADCLNLNVTTPRGAASPSSLSSSSPPLPVVVWFHGGANKQGSNAESGLFVLGNALEGQNVVTVSVNYRLGALGFMHLPKQGVTNLGLRDTIAALEWVQREIAAFGGDPSNVTLYGESAGAVAIAALLASTAPQRGLFHKAYLSSGGYVRVENLFMFHDIVRLPFH
jgi:para-nitrobenzyl esterase